MKVYINYSQDFADTAKCKDAALSQINQHQADIIFQVAGGCGVGALDAANSKNVYGIGVDANQGYLYPSVITSAQKRVDVSVYTIIDLTEKGKYSNSLPKFDLTNNGVTYSPPSSGQFLLMQKQLRTRMQLRSSQDHWLYPKLFQILICL